MLSAPGLVDTTSPNKAEEEAVAENSNEQGDEDSITMDAGRQEAGEGSEQGVSLLLRSVLFIFRYLVLCFKIILGIWYHTFYDFEVYWYLVGKISGILVSHYPLAGPEKSFPLLSQTLRFYLSDCPISYINFCFLILKINTP